MKLEIPQEDWSYYPEVTPKDYGYYFTEYQDDDTGVMYNKCIKWCNHMKNWVSWRYPGSSHNFTVKMFLLNTRTEYYCPCLQKTCELYGIK